MHPSFAKTAKAEVKLANTGCRFEPRMVLLRSTQTLLVQNPDSVGHNTKMDPIDQVKNPGQNFNLPAGSTLKHKFNAAESFPAFPVSCSIHPWMAAYIHVSDHPFSAVSGEDGSFEIKHVPSGVELEFRLWHESANKLGEVNVNDSEAQYSKGKMKRTFVADEEVDWTIEIDVANFSHLFK